MTRSLACLLIVATLATVARQHHNASVTSPAPFSGVAASNAREDWAVALLTALGNAQPSADTVALVVAWQTGENTTARFNPLATSQEMDGATVFNSHGVKEYATFEDGIAATVKTLSYAYDGYADILAGLQTNDPERAMAGLTRSPWAAEAGYGARVRALWGKTKDERRTVIDERRTTNAAKAAPMPDWKARINSRFTTVDCRYWYMQTGCQHFGTDIMGDGEGTPFYAPYAGTYRACVDNGDSGPYVGKWIEYTTDDGAELLINHFRDSPYCGAPVGARIEAGALLGTMRADANHVHVQVSVGGELRDFERFWEAH